MPASRAEGQRRRRRRRRAAAGRTERRRGPAVAAPAPARRRCRPRPPTWPPPPQGARVRTASRKASLLPAASPTGNGDPTDYDIGAGDTVIVQAAETLGHFADWSKVSSASLRALNKLHKNAMVTLGRKAEAGLNAGRPPRNSRRRAADITGTSRKPFLPRTYFRHRKLRGEEGRIVVDDRPAAWGLAVMAGRPNTTPMWISATFGRVPPLPCRR